MIKNLRLLVAETDPVINILNSNNITFDKLLFNDAAELLVNVKGERSSLIKLKNSDSSKAKNKVKAELGAKENAVVIE